jgi:hypothetical protein
LPASFVSSNVANEAHFQIFKHSYLASISKIDTLENGRLIFFDWGGDSMIGFDRFLVFDESDEIILPASQRSGLFETKLTDHGFNGDAQFQLIQTVARHFYVIDYR